MHRTEIAAKVKDILIDELMLTVDLANSLKPETHLINELGADSLDVVEVAMRLEIEFEIEIPDDDLEQVETFESLVNLVDTKLNR